MKRRSSILIISGVDIAAIISAVAVSTHFRLLATEGQEHGNETAQEIANEILTGQPARANEKAGNVTGSTNNTSSTLSHSESEETPEQRAAEGK